MQLVSWPNAISLLRVPLAALFLATDDVGARAAILTVAAFSDFADGWLARRLGRTSRVGEILDPLADKAFLVTALVTLALGGLLKTWELLVLLARDVFTVAAFLTALLFRLPVRFRARLGGKIVTGIQIVVVLALLLRPARVGPLVAVAGAAGLFAVVDYTRAGLRALRGEARNV
ncbi:MAG: CDP-alcohol phosphatidyltransferase family protein [bacterium]|jgi:cardiolipin synthase|nr:MAG: CDP-alcohol phosphatidyltransferase [bacterium]